MVFWGKCGVFWSAVRFFGFYCRFGVFVRFLNLSVLFWLYDGVLKEGFRGFFGVVGCGIGLVSAVLFCCR